MQTKKMRRGFTLIELIIVVAIITILVGVAFPAYTESVRKASRSDAKAELTDVAQRLQRCFTAYSTYNNSGCGVATEYGGGSVISQEGLYNVTATINATTFTLTAAPAGKQASDKCGSLAQTNTGLRGVSTSASVDECW